MKTYVNCIKIILIGCIIYLLTGNTIYAQSPVSYTYDGNGNRLTRSITLKKSFAPTDSIFKEEIIKEDIGNAQVRIYPNPTKGSLTIEVSGEYEGNIIEYSLFNVSGTLLIKQKISDPMFSIDFSNHPAGMYILRLYISNEVTDWKIIKE